MPVDFRWHAFTVIAIFLAVGLGVLIGAALPQDNVVLEKQQAVLSKLESELARLRDDKRQLAELTSELNAVAGRQNEMIQSLAGLAVSGRLSGKHVLFTEWGHVAPAIRDDLVATFEQSGATVVVETLTSGEGAAIAVTGNRLATGNEPDALVVISDEQFSLPSDSVNSIEAWLRTVSESIPVIMAPTTRAAGAEPRTAGEFRTQVVGPVDDILGRVELVIALSRRLAGEFAGEHGEAGR